MTWADIWSAKLHSRTYILRVLFTNGSYLSAWLNIECSIKLKLVLYKVKTCWDKVCQEKLVIRAYVLSTALKCQCLCPEDVNLGGTLVNVSWWLLLGRATVPGEAGLCLHWPPPPDCPALCAWISHGQYWTLVDFSQLFCHFESPVYNGFWLISTDKINISVCATDWSINWLLQALRFFSYLHLLAASFF